MIARRATLLFAFALVTGCSTRARFVTTDELTPGVGIVAVPSTSVLRWYYRHEAFKYIRKYQNPNFKEEDIFDARVVAVDQQVAPKGGRRSGNFNNRPDGHNIPFEDSMRDQKSVTTSDKTEYLIWYRLPPKTIVTSSVKTPPPGGAGQPLPMSGVAGGIAMPNGPQNASYPPASGRPAAPMNSGMPMGGYPNQSPAQPSGPFPAPMNTGVAPGTYPIAPNNYPNPNYATPPNAGAPNNYPNPNYAAPPNPGASNGYPNANAAPGIVYPNQGYPAPVSQPAPGTQTPVWQGNGGRP